MSIAENIARVQEQISAAARRAGRKPEEITLMAVSKTFPPAAIREAHAAGVRMFGENKVQEFSSKAGNLGDLADAEWHLIGHLQTNKSAHAAELFCAVDSIDSLRLAQRLNTAAERCGKKLGALLEINLGGETAKTGLAPASPELEEILHGAPQLDHLEIRGLMAIPPFSEDPEGARPYFRRLRVLQQEIAARRLASVDLRVLSMGMSHDFEVAIEEGSTCLRIGTAIFGPR